MSHETDGRPVGREFIPRRPVEPATHAAGDKPPPYRFPKAARAVLAYAGIDLTAGRRPSDLAALDLAGERVIFATCLSDDDLLRALGEVGAEVVAIDSPMGLPAGLCCLEESCACGPTLGLTGRSAERELARLGISCFWTTKRTIIKSMIYRAIALKERLEAEGYVVLEVFPYAVKRVLLRGRLPRKNTPLGLSALTDGVSGLLPRCRWPEDWQPSHDQLDALLCALTAHAFGLGEVDLLGDPAEVPIVLPRRPEGIGHRAKRPPSSPTARGVGPSHPACS
jgi:predicted nuclease with RNAse H fold